jgi:hypothetical protein
VRSSVALNLMQGNRVHLSIGISSTLSAVGTREGEEGSASVGVGVAEASLFTDKGQSGPASQLLSLNDRVIIF